MVWLIHLCFDVMVGLGFLLLLAGLWALYAWWRHRQLPRQRLFWLLGAVSGVAAIVAMECGWVVTEVGRQPWVVYRLQTTAAAATRNGGVLASLSIIIVIYAVLGAATILILRMLARRWRRADGRRDRGALRPAARAAAGRGAGAGRAVIAATVGAILLATVTLYAILGGADFGGGLWDLLAGGDRRGRAPRTLIDESITPVWEANHVWLVFALVIFWTAFPDAFAAVMTVAALPIWLAVAGIVLRGAGFAFRKEVTRLSLERALGATFAFSSLLTPFFMGAVVGGIADGQIPDRHTQASLAAWTQPTSVLTGFLFVGACGYLAAVYLIGEAARRGDHRMQAYFTRRAQLAAVADRGAVPGHAGRAAQLRPHAVHPAHRPGAAAGDRGRGERRGGAGPADHRPAARRPGAGRARRGRGGVGLGRGPVPGAAARHRGDAEQRGRPGIHAGRDRRAVRRARRAHRAVVRAAVRVAGPPAAAGGGEVAVLATAAAQPAAQPGGRSTARTVVLGVVAAGALARALRRRPRGQ